MTMHGMPVDPFLQRTYVARLSALYHQPAEAILSRRRFVVLSEARHVLWLALATDGYTLMAIAAAAGRDHATIHNGLCRARQRPELVERAHEIRQLLVPDSLNPRLLECSPAEARQLVAYLWWLIGRRAFDCSTLAAIRTLGRRPRLRARLKEVCSRYKCAGELWRMEVHAKQIGAPWQALEHGAAAASF